MTKDDIIRMARKAGSFIELVKEKDIQWLIRFAELVAEAEAERIKMHSAPVISQVNDHFRRLENAVLEEREACAKVCEYADAEGHDLESAAALIRARGTA